MGLVRGFHSFEFTDEIHQYVLGPVFDQRFGFGLFPNLIRDRLEDFRPPTRNNNHQGLAQD